jgi:hypothetical protein
VTSPRWSLVYWLVSYVFETFPIECMTFYFELESYSSFNQAFDFASCLTLIQSLSMIEYYLGSLFLCAMVIQVKIYPDCLYLVLIKSFNHLVTSIRSLSSYNFSRTLHRWRLTYFFSLRYLSYHLRIQDFNSAIEIFLSWERSLK